MATAALATPAEDREARTRRAERAQATLDLDAPFFGALLHQRMQAYDAFIEPALPATLTVGQIHVLWQLEKHEPCTQTRLVEVMGMDRSTLADVVRRLVRRRLVARKRTKEDQRAYAVTLTEDGRKVLKEARAVIQRQERTLAPKILSTLQGSVA